MQRSPTWLPPLGQSLRPMLLTEEDYVKQQIFNIVNSFQQPDFSSAMEQGSSISVSQVSIRRYQYNVAGLFALQKKDLANDKDWQKMKGILGDEALPFELFNGMWNEFKQQFKVKVPDLGRV